MPPELEAGDLGRIIRSGRRRPLFVPGETTSEVLLGRDALECMLPHRDPFLLLDAITRVDLHAEAVSGPRLVAEEDPVFKGHFPGDPVYPGVLLLEMIGQLGICLQHLLSVGRTHIGAAHGDRPRPLRLLKVQHAIFQGAVRPGERLELIAKSVEDSDYVSTCAGQAVVDGQVKVFAIYDVFHLEENEA